MELFGLTAPVTELPDGTDHDHLAAKPQPTTKHPTQPTGRCKTLHRQKNWHISTALQFSLLFQLLLGNCFSSDHSLLYQVQTSWYNSNFLKLPWTSNTEVCSWIQGIFCAKPHLKQGKDSGMRAVLGFYTYSLVSWGLGLGTASVRRSSNSAHRRWASL